MRIRLGLHRNSGRADAAFRDYVAKVRPNVVKILDPSGDDEALAAWCRGLGVEVIGRIYFDPQQLGAGGGRQIYEVLAAARRFPSIGFWELHNEAHQSGEDLARYAELSIDFMKRMDAQGNGQKAVIGCFSVGMPDLPEGDSGAQWRLFAPALRHAAQHGHYLGLHQYGGGSRGMRFAPLWYALRHRLVLAWAKGQRLPMPKILITEAGIDHLEKADMPTRGWQTMPQGYDYPADLHWLCQSLSDDPEVAGVVDFGWAPIDPQWKPFDLSDHPAELGRLTALMAAPVEEPKEPPVAADLHLMLQSALGSSYSDLRYSLPINPSGPNGDFGLRPWPGLEYLAIHHTAGPKSGQWTDIAADHIRPKAQGGRGWAGIGYHLGLRGGRLSYLGDAGLARACCADLNHKVLCLAVTGNYESETVDLADAAMLRRAVAVIQHWATLRLGRRLKVVGHGELPGQATVCPGKNLRPLVAELAGQGAAAAPLRYDKIAFQLEEADRRLQAEGYRAEARFVASAYTADAIKRRDVK